MEITTGKKKARQNILLAFLIALSSDIAIVVSNAMKSGAWPTEIGFYSVILLAIGAFSLLLVIRSTIRRIEFHQEEIRIGYFLRRPVRIPKNSIYEINFEKRAKYSTYRVLTQPLDSIDKRVHWFTDKDFDSKGQTELRRMMSDFATAKDK